MKFARPHFFCLGITLIISSSVMGADDSLPLNIQVRSEVDQPFKGFRKEPLKEHGKVYAIASVSEARGDESLVMPIKEDLLLKHLTKELAKRGFRPATVAEPPEIVLTVLCGRGFLRNPYLDDVFMDETTSPPTASITGLPTNLINQRKAFYEMRLQAAQSEKLFIRVTAWANPDTQPEPKPGKKKKPKLLWKTTMVTDDPANRDLNQFMEKMLAAGSEFFDRKIKDEEALITTDLPVGNVQLGDATEVPDDEKPGK
jgi:hypothetical protein